MEMDELIWWGEDIETENPETLATAEDGTKRGSQKKRQRKGQ